MATDLALTAADIIHLYGLRFKVEHSFKQAVRLIGAFAYHFWMMDMTPLRYRNGNQHLHRRSADYRNHVRRKMRPYHVFIQAGVVAQGLLQYLAVAAPELVWDSFGSWLRTIRPGIPPSEFVVVAEFIANRHNQHATGSRRWCVRLLARYPFLGAIFIFRSKRADRLKIAAWDGSGLVLLWKRLEHGAFRRRDATDRSSPRS
jgi:hypothetical protein